MKQFYFKDPVFWMWAQFFTECEADDMIEKTEYDIDSDVSSWTIWLTIHEKGLPPAIWVKDKNDLATVVHEINHAVLYISEYLGMKLSIETTEFFAYYSDFLFRCYQEWVLGIKWKIGLYAIQSNESYHISLTEEVINGALKKKKKLNGKKNKKNSKPKWDS